VPAPGADRKLYPGKGTEMLTSLVDVLPLLEGTPQ